MFGFPMKIKNSFNLPQLLVIFINEISIKVRSKYVRYENYEREEFQITGKRISSSRRVIAL
jgi:hypothetical protein